MKPRIPFICAALVAATGPAVAGGMLLPLRGVRTLERGGAFIAGADDADALWLDPAGLAHISGAGARQFLFDVGYVYQTVNYTPIDATGTTLAPVENLQPGNTPIPGLAAAFGIDDKLTVAGGFTAPYAGTHRYDDTGPSRYASVGVNGTSFVMVTVGAAYKVSDTLRVGATIVDFVSQVKAKVTSSMCLGPAACDPTDRSYDSLMQFEQTDFTGPTGSLGVQWDAHPRVTLGLAVQGPARISSKGTLTISKPTNSQFDDMTVSGDQASLSLTLPPAVRAGVEVRPTDSLHVEAALAVELWNFHDQITLAPDNIRLDHIGLMGGSYTLKDMVISRDFKASYAPSLGVEYRGGGVMLGAGLSYETAAAPRGKNSVLSPDADKWIVGFGGGYDMAGWQIGASVGYVALDTVDVSLAGGSVTQLQPINTNPSRVVVNAGRYESAYWLGGLRAARRF